MNIFLLFRILQFIQVVFVTVSTTGRFVVMDAGVRLVYMLKMPSRSMAGTTMMRISLIWTLDLMLILGYQLQPLEELSATNMVYRKNRVTIAQWFFAAHHVLCAKRRVNSRFEITCQVNLFCLWESFAFLYLHFLMNESGWKVQVLQMKWKKYFDLIEKSIDMWLNKSVDFAPIYSITVSRGLQIRYQCHRKWRTCIFVILPLYLIELYWSLKVNNCQVSLYF